MIVADMIQRVRTGLDDRASDYEEAELLKVMQTIWKWHLPNRVDPGMLRTVQPFTLTAGQVQVVLGDPLHVGWPNQLIRLEKVWADSLQKYEIYTDRLDFNVNAPSFSVLYEYGSNNQAFYFKPVPSVDTLIWVMGKFSQNPFDEAVGIDNDEWALAVTRGAVLDLAIQEGWTEIAAEYATYYQGSISTLRGLRYSEPRQMAQRPDF